MLACDRFYTRRFGCGGWKTRTGLTEVKQRGGIAVVQDPEEAAYPSMPLTTLRHMTVDHRVPVAAMLWRSR